MKTNIKSQLGLAITAMAIAATSCIPLEDPGGLIDETRTYEVDSFDRLEMGDAFDINVEVGEAQSVTIKGDARNINDLIVSADNGTLKIRFDEYRNRRHRTYITITMPELEAINFSGASTSVVRGVQTDELNVILSGASKLNLFGSGAKMNANISGASKFYAFDYFADDVYADVSGASKAQVYAALELDAIASGASYIGYKGNPVVHANSSGASTIRRD